MTSTPSIEVDLKGQEATNQVFLSQIDNLPYIKQKDIYQNIEYYISTGISVFLWSYFTTSAGFRSYNFVINNKLELDLSYLSKYRDYQDLQWKYFRTHLFIFSLIGLIFVIISKIMRKYNNEYFRYFYSISGFCFAIYLINVRVIYILIAMIIFFYSSKLVNIGDKNFTILTWCELLLCKYGITKLEKIFTLKNIFKGTNDIDDLSYEFITTYALMRMFSFNIEYKKIFYDQTVPESIFSLNQARSHCMECYNGNFCSKCLENAVIAEKDKIENSFDIINFTNYVFYLPLLFNGPLINYNNFMFQLGIWKDSQHNDLKKMNKVLYLLKLLLLLIIMEVYNHFLFPIFLFRNGYNTCEPNKGISLFYYCFICLNILTFLWLKFSIIWKFGRLLAWYDGIYVEENMNRIIYNIYSLEEFFRGMNRSFNRWIVRYLYIPLGGKNKKYVNIWAIFAFAYFIFNFENGDYLIYSIACCVLLDIEIFAKYTFVNKYGEDFNEKIHLRYLKYFVASIYLLILFIVSLIG
jgi:D-alanyl-lipoteichoic acid acyltransferase DltB (MBOAT superfamily)